MEPRRDQVLELISQDAERWRPYLDEMLVNFGLRVRKWQIGSTQTPDAFWKPDLQELVEIATNSLSQFIPEPSIIIPFSADQETPDTLILDGVHIAAPPEVRPEALPEYARAWTADERDVLVTFGVLSGDRFTPRQQVLDLLLRGLHGWRIGLPVMSIEAPWQWESEYDTAIMPHPTFLRSCRPVTLQHHAIPVRVSGKTHLLSTRNRW